MCNELPRHTWKSKCKGCQSAADRHSANECRSAPSDKRATSTPVVHNRSCGMTGLAISWRRPVKTTFAPCPRILVLGLGTLATSGARSRGAAYWLNCWDQARVQCIYSQMIKDSMQMARDCRHKTRDCKQMTRDCIKR
jgi:hypothetical protein